MKRVLQASASAPAYNSLQIRPDAWNHNERHYGAAFRWGGFTTHDLKPCRLAGVVALIYNWWSLLVRLADPDHHREAVTT
jgi:hypothetical protein